MFRKKVPIEVLFYCSLSLYDVCGGPDTGLAVEGDLSCGAKFDCTVFGSKERVVSSKTYVLSWEDFCATLSDDDRSRSCLLTIAEFCAEIFRIGIFKIL